jgi:hypothetical protein
VTEWSHIQFVTDVLNLQTNKQTTQTIN